VVGGLMDETDPNNGLTNLMTQLSIKGTTHYPAQQIVDYFDGIGGALSAGCGNNTFYYRAEVMPQDLTKAFDIYREIVLEPNFPDVELAKLKPQVLAAIQQVKNSWPAEARLVFQRDFFANSPYRRQSLGTESSVAAITREQIRAFHREAAVAQRAVLAIFGDIDADAVEKMVRERFAPEPPITAPRQFVEKTAKPGATVYIGFPGMKITNVQDRYPMEVMTEVIGSNTGWLHELLRGRQLVYYAWGFSAPGLLPGYVAATAQCEADKAPEVLRLIQEQLAKAARGEFAEAEVNHAKSNQINAEILEKQTNADAATTAALDELYGFGFNWSEGYTDRIMAVTLADVQNVAKKYLSAPPTVSIVTSAPESFAPAGAK
jgi:zinc protease